VTTLSRRRLLALAGGVALSACTAPPPSRGAGATGKPDSPLAANAALDVWPTSVGALPAQIREAYAYAATVPRSLRYIPCYCGCANVGHGDNLACYVRSEAGGGWVVLDLHAAGCGVCVGITRDVMAMERAGRPLAEIRRAVDQRWASAGPGTPTPFPE